MKKILSFIFCSMIIHTIFSQLPYSWVPSVNPGWVSTSGTGSTLNWQAGCNVVTTNCTGNYINNSNSIYTSPSINASCNNASTISITFQAYGNLEYGFDFLFIEYSLDNGTTWINPYGSGIGWTGNFGLAPGTIIPAIILTANPNIKFRFRFTSDNTVVSSGLKITDFDVVCNIVLPVTLLNFNATCNKIYWSTASEQNCDYYQVYSSNDGYTWEEIAKINGAGNSQNILNYSIPVQNRELTYYKLTQIDFNGTRTEYDIITANCTEKAKEIIGFFNTLGQIVNGELATGVYYVLYEDGIAEKVFIQK